MVKYTLKYTCGYADTDNIRAWVDGERGNMSWAEFDRSGNLVSECKRGDFLFPGLTDRDMAEARDAISHMLPAPYVDAYLRFNDLPEGGRSKNFATGQMEAGVSCYALRWDLINQCYKRTGGGLDGAMIAYGIQGSPMYLITGTECGTGSDGEPVLEGAKILANLKFDKDKDGYILA